VRGRRGLRSDPVRRVLVLVACWWVGSSYSREVGKGMHTYLSYFKNTPVPLKPIVHIYRRSSVSYLSIDQCVGDGKAKWGGTRTDSILRILCCLKHDRPTSLGTSIDADVDVRAHDGTRMAEEVLDILPAGLVGQLWSVRCVRSAPEFSPYE